MTTSGEFAQKMEQLEGLLGEVERRCEPSSLEHVRELVRVLLDVHALGLRELLGELATSDGEATKTVSKLTRNDAVRSLLLMHDLHPDSLRERVTAALSVAHEVAGAHARAELSQVDGQHVVIRIIGESRAAGIGLRNALERLVPDYAPEAVLTLLGGEPPAPGFVPLERLLSRPGSAAE